MQTLINLFLDTIFPKSSMIRELEVMTPEKLLSMAALKDQNIQNASTAILAYRHPYVQSAIWEIKYKKNKKVAALLGDILKEELNKTKSGDFLIVPIPLSTQRKIERGYDQLELILSNISDPRIRFHILSKPIDTPAQSLSATRAERLKNLHGCFSVTRSEEVRGQNIVLIDDVLTTGSTFEEARKTLLEAGAKDVRCIALAH